MLAQGCHCSSSTSVARWVALIWHMVPHLIKSNASRSCSYSAALLQAVWAHVPALKSAGLRKAHFFILNYLIPWNWGWLCQFMQISLTHCTQNAVLYNQKVHSQMDMHHYWQLDFRVWKHVPQAIVFVFRLGLLVWLENSLRHCLTYDGACKTPTFCKLFCGNIQGDGWKFLGHCNRHSLSRISSTILKGLYLPIESKICNKTRVLRVLDFLSFFQDDVYAPSVPCVQTCCQYTSSGYVTDCKWRTNPAECY